MPAVSGSRLWLKACDVARLLDMSPDRFARRRRDLEAAGFPAADPAFGDRWSIAELEAFAARRAAPAIAGNLASEGRDWSAVLARRLETFHGGPAARIDAQGGRA